MSQQPQDASKIPHSTPISGASAILTIVATALSVIGKVMDLIPNYEQRKREKFHALREKYEIELKKPYGIRNDQLVLDLADELRRDVEEFSEILSASSLASVRKT